MVYPVRCLFQAHAYLCLSLATFSLRIRFSIGYVISLSIRYHIKWRTLGQTPMFYESYIQTCIVCRELNTCTYYCLGTYTCVCLCVLYSVLIIHAAKWGTMNAWTQQSLISPTAALSLPPLTLLSPQWTISESVRWMVYYPIQLCRQNIVLPVLYAVLLIVIQLRRLHYAL